MLWISPLTGPPGFLRVTSQAVLDVRTLPAEGDPLHQLPTDQPVGLIVVEFAGRRRLRINGTLSRTGGGGSATASDVGNPAGFVPLRRARVQTAGDMLRGSSLAVPTEVTAPLKEMVCPKHTDHEFAPTPEDEHCQKPNPPVDELNRSIHARTE
jgi:hypothetical protein